MGSLRPSRPGPPARVNSLLVPAFDSGLGPSDLSSGRPGPGSRSVAITSTCASITSAFSGLGSGYWPGPGLASGLGPGSGSYSGPGLASGFAVIMVI